MPIIMCALPLPMLRTDAHRTAYHPPAATFGKIIAACMFLSRHPEVVGKNPQEGAGARLTGGAAPPRRRTLQVAFNAASLHDRLTQPFNCNRRRGPKLQIFAVHCPRLRERQVDESG